MERKQFNDEVEKFLDFLEESLPSTDDVHRNEILDIAELLKQRAYKYVNNYGLN